MTNKILALDFGGTKLAAAVVNVGERNLFWVVEL
jgi:hexokinase